MRSEEALIGKRVRVREVARRSPSVPASVGTIKESWGDPSYTALDVLLDDGTQQLFWHHELEEISEREPTRPEARPRVERLERSLP